MVGEEVTHRVSQCKFLHLKLFQVHIWVIRGRSQNFPTVNCSESNYKNLNH